MLLSGEKLKAKHLEEDSRPSPAVPSLSVPKDVASASSASSSSPSSPRSGSSSRSGSGIVRSSSSSLSSSAQSAAPPRPASPRSESEPKLAPKLPQFVPLKAPRSSDWVSAAEHAPDMSPRTRNPSRSPRLSAPSIVPPALLPEPEPHDNPPPRPPKMPDDSDARVKKEKQWLNVVNEIVTSEEAYISQLSTILSVYRDPLLEARVLDDGENAALFSVYANLLHQHKAMLAEMQNKRAEIGQILSAQLMPMLSLYKVHINRFREMGDLLHSKYESDKNFRKVLSGLSHIPDTLIGMQALEIVRVASVQRLPRYVLLCKEAIKYTNDTSSAEAQAMLHIIQVLESTLQQLGNKL